jgi:hypothetical protein
MTALGLDARIEWGVPPALACFKNQLCNKGAALAWPKEATEHGVLTSRGSCTIYSGIFEAGFINSLMPRTISMSTSEIKTPEALSPLSY